MHNKLSVTEEQVSESKAKILGELQIGEEKEELGKVKKHFKNSLLSLEE